MTQGLQAETTNAKAKAFSFTLALFAVSMWLLDRFAPAPISSFVVCYSTVTARSSPSRQSCSWPSQSRARARKA